uniref:Uncharacterized protein n=1 Tax=Aegilops tauschii subsp. strangulata TaxID=200361 RepID=A0A453PB78_AEGTS
MICGVCWGPCSNSYLKASFLDVAAKLLELVNMALIRCYRTATLFVPLPFILISKLGHFHC